MKVTIYIE